MYPTEHEKYLAAREKWVHEDNLINYRLSWLLLSQTILFATYAVLLAAPNTVPQFERINKLLVILPWIGVVNLIIAYISILAALSAQYKLKEAIGREFEVTLGTLTLGGFILGHLAAIFLPGVFFVAWFVLIIP
ncbi:hypothetical protein PN482_03455 [Microcystis aeruginosa CS-555/01A07]|uniref:hypothetical protein n=1 Tax=Microcystis aeruginosa TaxID=1126 RepID=UPI00232DA9B7|nr:hypothetical protein [Microcystis aeruginosa]MDB9427997.1 hypothetical protein [Microcystis aeruginosa CS-555/01A07]